MHAELTPTTVTPALAPTALRSTVTTYTVMVALESSGGATFSYLDAQGDPVQDPSVEVQFNEVAVIQLNLDASSGKFEWSPVNWYSAPLSMGGEPVAQPSFIGVIRDGEQNVTIVSDNTESGRSGTFSYTLSVLFGGKVYTSSDPTIINHSDGI
jgi:hypothetical protein